MQDFDFMVDFAPVRSSITGSGGKFVILLDQAGTASACRFDSFFTPRTIANIRNA